MFMNVYCARNIKTNNRVINERLEMNRNRKIVENMNSDG